MEGRGPQRRALVWVRGLPSPLVASRSESAIAADLLAVDQHDARVRRVRSMLRQVNEVLRESHEAA